MADTVAGRGLTEAHRVAQVGLAGQAVAAALTIWSTLNPSNLPGTRAQWAQLMLALAAIFDARSARLAVAYMSQFRIVEGNPDGPIVGVEDFDAGRVAGSLEHFGPALVASHIALGRTPAEAKRNAQGSMAGAVYRHTLGGGRRVVDLSAIANPDSIGWRRVADGSPCKWCAMLVTRGPAYRSERSAGEGRKYHNKCGCTVEEVFSTWRPTAREREFAAAA